MLDLTEFQRRTATLRAGRTPATTFDYQIQEFDQNRVLKTILVLGFLLQLD
jgi:hypothetical protein